MADDILGKMRSQYEHRFRNDQKLKRIRKKLQNGADQAAAQEYAMASGEILSDVLKENVTKDLFGDVMPDAATLAGLIIPMMEDNYKHVVAASSASQKYMNTEGNLGINPIEPEFDRNSAMNIVGRMTNYDSFEEAEWLMDEPIRTNSQHIADESLCRNAEFQYRSGLKPKIVRTCESGACEWCQMLAGEYDIDEITGKDDPVYQRHNNCLCEITFVPGDGRTENITDQMVDIGDIDERISKSRKEAEKWRKEEEKRRKDRTSENKFISYQKPSGELRELSAEAHQSLNTLSIPEIYNNNFADYKPLNYTKDEIETIKELYKLGKETDCEYARILWPGGASDYLTSNLHDKVGFNLSDYDNNDLRIFHCHTNITPPSIDDYFLFVNEKVSEVSNVAANGDCFSVIIGSGIRPTEEEFQKAREMIDDWVLDDMKSNPLYKNLTEKEKNYTAIREASLRFARYFEWETYGGRLDE